MITDSNIEKLKKIFVTKVYFKNSLKLYATKKDISDMISLFLKEMTEMLSPLVVKTDDHQAGLNDHERRIEKLEEKSFPL